MRPGPAVKAKAHPKWREAWGCVARRPLCFRWAGQPWLRWSVAACSKLLRNGVPGGSMPWGQRKRCEKGEKEKRSGNEKGPEPLVAGPLLERSGGRTLWGYCPALQPPPGGGAVSSKPLPSHCGWLPLPCKYALNAMRCCDASRLAREGMDARCTWNSDDPRTATAPWQGRRRMAVRAAFTVGFRRRVVRWCVRGEDTES
jgi:hypothetical protein